MTRLCVGIDLGTTNTAVAFTNVDDSADNSAAPQVFSLTQTVQSQESAVLPLLPSFVYVPAAAELAPGALALPWTLSSSLSSAAGSMVTCVGVFAREQGARVPGRVVSSAKSWLSHTGVDRNSALLPVSAPDDVQKMSPVDASTLVLQHVADAWNHAHPTQRLQDQDVVLTVPASFDAVARSLTQEVAARVGLAHLTLLEEPQAALYAWLHNTGDSWRKQLKVGELILVIDVGGGTTDFSLIEVKDEAGTLQLHRVAVGDHILLGGDNMDLALAFRVKAKLAALEPPPQELDDWQLRGLVHACRNAKEAMLNDATIQITPIAIASKGKKLVGGTVRSELSRAELDDVLLEGFLPQVNADARPLRVPRAGLTTLGLPYAQDAAITRHLAAFLNGKRPQHLLFNGGVTASVVVRERLQQQLSTWLGAEVHVLDAADRDVAVALGAAVYGKARAGKGMRIKGGASRAYYVGIERAEMAVPGVAPRVDAVCIAPRGMEEGTEAEIPQELGLVVGEPATFRFFSSKDRDDVVAAVVDPRTTHLEELPPMEAELQGQSGAFVPVQLRARVTEVGTLELNAVEVSTHKRHKLEFNIRVE